MAGLTPSSAGEINNNVGIILRRFVDDRESVLHLQASLEPLDLKVEPYLMTLEDETLIKSAVNGLNTELQAVDMTFISRLVGMW
jgi:hypothetical protein